MINTIKMEAQEMMQVNATMVVAMIMARAWSWPCCGAGETGVSFISASRIEDHGDSTIDNKIYVCEIDG